jgi:hypothetical protein
MTSFLEKEEAEDMSSTLAFGYDYERKKREIIYIFSTLPPCNIFFRGFSLMVLF